MTAILKPLSARKVIKKLCSAGFNKTHQRGSHIYFVNEDSSKLVTVPKHGSKDIPIGTLRNIVVHQAGITIKDFLKL